MTLDHKPPSRQDEPARYACVVCRVHGDTPEDYAVKCVAGRERHVIVALAGNAPESPVEP